MAVSQGIEADLDLPVAATAAGALRRDLRLIADLIEPKCRVLDIGCGDGALLAFLATTKSVDARGMELSQEGVNACVRNGLSVIQGDADNDLEAYPDGAFDYVVLSQTLQATRRPRAVLESLARIGGRAIVSFPNFGYWRVRLRLLSSGRMPSSALLGHHWYDTPNIHLCTIRDFIALASELGLAIERAQILDHDGNPYGFAFDGGLANWLAEQAVFVLKRDVPGRHTGAPAGR
ncbi:MAG TPA: methionine biosynthesis protein MetW [Stellaceae bacterium]|nr:methionine biosynthesis protein MetW [Stellaceae bacterium]